MEKIRSKGWVGNIYHKFEAMCQEVDEFVTKDTVKYVENQVQTVGQSMKKLYSGVVQDFRIPMDDPVKTEAQAIDGMQKYTVDTYTSSVTGTTQNPVKEQSSVDQDANDSFESHSPSTSTELDGVIASEAVENNFSAGNDSATATCKSSDKVFEENITREEELVDEELSYPEDRISSKSCSEEDSEDTMCYSFSDDDRCFSDVSSSQVILQDDIIGEEQPLTEVSSSIMDNLSESPLRASEKNKKTFDSSPDANNCVSIVPSSQIALQQNITREVRPVTDQSDSFGDMALSQTLPFLMEKGHGNSITAKFTHPTSLSDTELGTFPEDERGCNWFSDAAESISDVSITRMLLQDNITGEDRLSLKEPSSASDRYLPQTPAFASNIPLTSPDDTGVEVSMTVCNSSLDDVTCVFENTAGAFEDTPSTFQSSELVLSRVPLDNESVDVDTGVSNSSLLAQPSNLSISSIGNCKEAESDSSISAGLSSSFSTSSASANNVVTVITALSSAGSLTDFSDVNASSSHESAGNDGSIKNDLDWCPSPQLKALICPTEIGCTNDRYVDLPGMETIDLTDKGKLEGSCVLVDNKLHNAVSFRPRKYKSYKELIQEAFASRKRLIKEYKQLAVLYADVDSETSQHTELSSLPLPCLHSTESATCNICESEWELL